MRQKLVNFSTSLTLIYLFYLPFPALQRSETGVNVPKCFDVHEPILVVCAHTQF